MSKLTPCPLCMAEAQYYVRQETGYSIVGVECSQGCDCRVEQEGNTSTIFPESIDKVQASWNHRPVEDVLRKALQSIYDEFRFTEASKDSLMVLHKAEQALTFWKE